MGTGEKWTDEEKQYLQDNWGTLSKQTIAKNLNRSVDSIDVMKYRLGLGTFLENGDYITWNQFQKVIGTTSSSYKSKSWINNRSFPLHMKKVGKCSFKIVYIDEFWKWAEKNKDLLDFSKIEKNILGIEPEWVADKRRHDFEKSRKYITTPWTKSEDEKLKYLLKQHKYSYMELSKMLRRTNGAIQRRIIDLGLKERPVKADNHTKWTEEERNLLIDLILAGYGYEYISEHIHRSAKAIRGRVGVFYGSENLDKVRLKLLAS